MVYFGHHPRVRTTTSKFANVTRESLCLFTGFAIHPLPSIDYDNGKHGLSSILRIWHLPDASGQCPSSIHSSCLLGFWSFIIYNHDCCTPGLRITIFNYIRVGQTITYEPLFGRKALPSSWNVKLLKMAVDELMQKVQRDVQLNQR